MDHTDKITMSNLISMLYQLHDRNSTVADDLEIHITAPSIICTLKELQNSDIEIKKITYDGAQNFLSIEI